jgi:uncharacterized protein (DUF488 family)
MPAIWTVGHSNRSAEDLIAILVENGIAVVADVRRYPVSRRFPQHGRARLEAALADAGIEYVFLGQELGGRLEPTVPIDRSRNGALREPAFRAYADALESADVRAGLARLEELGRAQRAAFLCAEKDWHGCHRRIVSDALTARGWQVIHLTGAGAAEPHALDPRARIESGTVSYPSLL